MDRRGQLGNVAFGGAWSERIPRREALMRALETVKAAPAQTLEEDLREDRSLAEALEMVSAAHPRGPSLVLAWQKALDRTRPDERQVELARISGIFAAWIGDKSRSDLPR